MGAQRLDDGLTLQFNLLLELDVLRRSTYLDDERARFDVPLTNIVLVTVEA